MIKEEKIYVTEDGHKFHDREEAEKYEIEHSSKEDLYNIIKELRKEIEQLESDLLRERAKNIFPPNSTSPWVQPSPNTLPNPWDYPPVIYHNKAYVGVKDGIYQTLNESEYNKLSEEDKKKYIGISEFQSNF